MEKKTDTTLKQRRSVGNTYTLTRESFKLLWKHVQTRQSLRSTWRKWWRMMMTKQVPKSRWLALLAWWAKNALVIMWTGPIVLFTFVVKNFCLQHHKQETGTLLMTSLLRLTILVKQRRDPTLAFRKLSHLAFWTGVREPTTAPRRPRQDCVGAAPLLEHEHLVLELLPQRSPLHSPPGIAALMALGQPPKRSDRALPSRSCHGTQGASASLHWLGLRRCGEWLCVGVLDMFKDLSACPPPIVLYGEDVSLLPEPNAGRRISLSDPKSANHPLARVLATPPSWQPAWCERKTWKSRPSVCRDSTGRTKEF